MIIMKRFSRFLLIGLMHSSIYLWLLPYVIKPRVSDEILMTATLISTTISIILTVSIIRLPGYLRRIKAKT